MTPPPAPPLIGADRLLYAGHANADAYWQWLADYVVAQKIPN